MRGELPAKARTLPVSPVSPAECQSNQVLMSKCIDRELSPDETAALKAHLLECETCRTQLKDWKEQSAMTRKALDAVWKSEGARAWSVLPRAERKRS